MSTDGVAQPAEMSRAELEERVEELEKIADLIEVKGVEDPADANLTDIWIAGAPMGKILQNTKTRALENESRLDDVEETSEVNSSVNQGMPEDVRDKLLPIHKMWIDVREGDEQGLPSAEVRRGARLFGRFIKKATGEPNVGVTVDRHNYTMSTQSATEVLREEDDLNVAKSSEPMTVKRAMEAVQRMSKNQPCDCPAPDACDHGLVEINATGGTNQLRIKKEQFHVAMGNAEAAINGAVNHDSTPDDSESNADEGDTADADVRDAETAADEAFDELEAASHGGPA